MPEIKWIKLTTSMFDDEKIDYIESLPDADSILVIWIKLLTLAGKCNAGGYIFLTESIPYTDEMLSHKFKRPLNTVKLALTSFINLNMVIMVDGFLVIRNWDKHQNINGLDKIRESNRIRQQRFREKIKLLPNGNVSVTLRHDTDIDLDLDKDKEKASAAPAAVFSDVIDTFNKNIHLVMPIEAEKLADWNNDMDADVILAAISEAVTHNARNLGYIESILRSWHDKGIRKKADLLSLKSPTGKLKNDSKSITKSSIDKRR